MKLYYSPGACSMDSHILFHEWGITHSIERVDLKTHQTETGKDFYKINSKGYVPALEMDNGGLLTENIAILVYLSDLQNSPKKQNYHFLEWLAFISTELHKGIGSLFGYKNGPEEVVKAIKEKVAKRLQFVEEQLAGKEYIFGTDFSAADAYLFTVLSWCPTVKIDLAPYKNIGAYLKKMTQRISIQRTLQLEGLVK